MTASLEFNEAELETFWRFITERQAIWHRRFIEKRPAPWTSNLALQRHRFTNVYRELDTGTRYAMKEILEREAPRPDIAFNIMIYRLMCSIPTYGGFGFRSLDEWSEEEFDEYLRDIYNTGSPVFGNAYLISPYSSMGSKFKFRNVSRLFGLIHRDFEDFWKRLDTAPTFEKAFKVLNGTYGFGPFLAYQVMVDLTYPLPRTQYGSAIIPFSQDDWARLGPGALRGFARLSSSRETLNGLRWLHRSQRQEFERLGLTFHYLLDAEGNEVEISLANMQNSLCEYHKYRSIQDGTGKSQRIFVPS
jgi:hypothetical protein